MQLGQVRTLLARFLRGREASVAPMLAMMALPLFGLVGAGIDYGRAASARTSMQAALDATALMLAKTASSSTQDQIQQSAKTLFDANYHNPYTPSPTVNATYSSQQSGGGSTLTVTANTSVATEFMRLLGYSQIAISSSATTAWGMSKLRVALVLDNTGSMAQSSKMTYLKTAAHNLLSQLQAAASNPGDVYVSIIPFSKDVNVGSANSGASWIDWSDWEAVNGNCSKSSYTNKTSCQNAGKVWTPKNHNVWNGCVTDRTQNNDTMNTPPTAGTTLFPAEQYGSCPEQIMPLSDDWTALNAKIDAMQPEGNTNQAVGLAWGWQSLSQVAPLNAPPLDPNYQYQQVIILLSDGLNTEDRWYTNASSIDARQQIACNNIKAAGITIYSVLVMSGDSATLKNCASDSKKYFALTSANQMITAFSTIGTNLTKLHLAY
jgi:Flp pilus assembly protein TadG